MPELPTGTVTFLFSDVEGSTELLRRLRDGYAEVMADHERLLRSAFQDCGGHEINTQGDSFFVAFRKPKDAVGAAVDAQRALARHPWPAEAEMRVRIGIHTGEATLVAAQLADQHEVAEIEGEPAAPEPTGKVRVLIVDDQALVRTGFRMILDAEEDMDVVGEASNGNDAITEAGRLRPDVVLMDVRMPELDGIEATRRLLADGGVDSKVVMLTTFDMDEYVYEALRAGASGFLLKDAPPEQLVDGIRAVCSGDALLAPSVTRRVIEEFVRRPPGAVRTEPAEIEELTPKECEVLKLMARGLSNAEIAQSLVVSETTVKTHVGRVLMKMGLRDRVQAVVMAYECGLVQPGQAGSASAPA